MQVDTSLTPKPTPFHELPFARGDAKRRRQSGRPFSGAIQERRKLKRREKRQNNCKDGIQVRQQVRILFLPLAQAISSGFNEKKPPKRTDMAAVNLSRAFDTVNHDILITKLISTEIHSNIMRWLSCYLKGRHQAVVFQGKKSRYKQN